MCIFLLFVILVISRFGFEGWIWVLIASVPDHYFLLYTGSFRCEYKPKYHSIYMINVHGVMGKTKNGNAERFCVNKA